METETTTTVPGTGGLAAALARAQGEMSAAIKDRKNPAFNMMYATLAAVIEAIRPSLSKHGIAFVQLPTVTPTVAADGKIVEVRVSVTTMLMYKDESIANTLSAKLVRDDVQAIGTVITYLRRYSLMAMAGVAPDDDDDGNSVSGKETQPPARRQEPAPKKEEPKPKPEPAPAEDIAKDRAELATRLANVFKTLSVPPNLTNEELTRAEKAVFPTGIDGLTHEKVKENMAKLLKPSEAALKYIRGQLVTANILPANT